MAVKDDGVLYPTEAIVSRRPRKHYRVPVRSQHWQLRSIISAERRHIIYFPGGNGSNHVQRLNTTTRECETIRLLAFAPRCLVAGNGWLCCGSENGDFVAIALDNPEGNPDADVSDNFDLGLDLDPDARLPLSFDSSREDSILSLIARSRRATKMTVAKSVKMAKGRVNCITLWTPPTIVPVSDGAYPGPVAVLANNDRTVTLVGLQDYDQDDKADALDVLTYPDFVNRAIISPDGGMLVAVLDDPYLYIHQRVAKSPETTPRSRSRPTYKWELTQRLLLKSQRKDDRSDSRGSFAACFSPSGSYFAVGTQHGTISIFNTELLRDPDADPLIATFKSSRPESGPGAVRDMAFCPGPFDILAWTEDRGHVGVADVRSNFTCHQILDINEEARFEHINVLDHNTVDPRLLDRHDRRSSVPSSGLGANAEPVGARRQGVEGLESLNHPLTANETMVLEAIQGDRRRRDRAQRGAEEMQTRLANMSRAVAASLRPAPAEGESQGTRERSSSTSRVLGDPLGNHGYRDQRERTQERVRSARQLIREASDRQTLTRRGGDQRWMERLGETVAAMRDQRDRQDSSYLSVLEILQARERSTNEGGTDNDDSSLLVPLVNQVVNRWEESAIRGTLSPDYGVFEVPPSPDNTSGLAWSEDGCILFVGAQNGIYEFSINVHSRKFYPSITLR